MPLPLLYPKQRQIFNDVIFQEFGIMSYICLGVVSQSCLEWVCVLPLLLEQIFIVLQRSPTGLVEISPNIVFGVAK